MSPSRSRITVFGVASALVLVVAVAVAQPPGGGRGRDAAHRLDHEVFDYLLAHRTAIERRVDRLVNGVETTTESSDPEVAAKIREHVAAMSARLRDGRPIHRRDPLFAEIFRHAAEIEIVEEPTARGIRVRETSRNAYVVALIQAHADVVSQFIANGHSEMRRDHPLPPQPTAAASGE